MLERNFPRHSLKLCEISGSRVCGGSYRGVGTTNFESNRCKQLLSGNESTVSSNRHTADSAQTGSFEGADIPRKESEISGNCFHRVSTVSRYVRANC